MCVWGRGEGCGWESVGGGGCVWCVCVLLKLPLAGGWGQWVMMVWVMMMCVGG